MHYTEICGSLSKEICMSNMRRSVCSMNKLTCQHKSLPSVHTDPTWLSVSEALACVVALKWMPDKWLFANQSATSDTKEATTTLTGVVRGNRGCTRHCTHQCCYSPSTSVPLSSPQGSKLHLPGFRPKCTPLVRCFPLPHRLVSCLEYSYQHQWRKRRGKALIATLP